MDSSQALREWLDTAQEYPKQTEDCHSVKLLSNNVLVFIVHRQI